MCWTHNSAASWTVRQMVRVLADPGADYVIRCTLQSIEPTNYSLVGGRGPREPSGGKILRAVLGPQDLPLEGLGCSQAEILYQGLYDPIYDPAGPTFGVLRGPSGK